MFERFSALVNLMADRSMLVVLFVLLNIFEKSVTFSKAAFLRLMSEILVPSNMEVVLVVSRKVVWARSTLERLVVPANMEEASVTFSNFALFSFRVETLEFLNIFAVFVAFLKSEFERSMVEILEFSKTEVKSSASEIFQEEKSGDVPIISRGVFKSACEMFGIFGKRDVSNFSNLSVFEGRFNILNG